MIFCDTDNHTHIISNKNESHNKLSTIEKQNQNQNQCKTVKLLTELESPKHMRFLYEMYIKQTYHFIRYDIKNHTNTCVKIANMFSKYPQIFLGDIRTEIQIDNNSVTLSINKWIKCESKSIPKQYVTIDFAVDYFDFVVEYYVCAVNNFPIFIVFRINKNIGNYEDKLINFVNLLIETPTSPSMIMIMSDEIHTQYNNNNQRTIIQADDFSKMSTKHKMIGNLFEKDMLGIIMFIFSMIVNTELTFGKRKKLVMSIILCCGITATYILMYSYLKCVNNDSP